jgi:uncharacterized damage-inducible protein DinB
MTPEVWLRGPIDGVPPLLQPVAHAVLQVCEEVEVLLRDFPAELLWTKPSGVASVGFHVQHMCGVIDRLSAYAEGRALDATQLAWLRSEGTPQPGASSTNELIAILRARVEQFIAQLRLIDQSTLANARTVGRAKLPSTVMGLLFHAAEHSQRHLGQLSVTVRIQAATQRAE